MMKKLENVLIVDDDHVACHIAQVVLKGHNRDITVSTAENGEVAVKLLSEQNKNRPSLILLDVNMPLMDGFEFLDWYHTHEFNDDLKIAMYTTSVMPEDKTTAMTYKYVVDYIEKPLSDDKINALLDRLYNGSINPLNGMVLE